MLIQSQIVGKKQSQLQTLESFGITVASWHYQRNTEDRYNHMEQFHHKKSRTIQTTDIQNQNIYLCMTDQ
jgi:hypothetical protein